VELTDAAAAWTGSELVVFGASLRLTDNRPATATAIGAAYNPRTGTWRRLPDSALSPQASTAVWSGREIIAWDYNADASAYNPALDRWRPLPKVPIDPGECLPRSVALHGRIAVVGQFCATLVTFDPTRDEWQPVARDDQAGWWLELIPAGSVVLVLRRDMITTTAEGILAFHPPA
jgi:hypothetical protein